MWGGIGPVVKEYKCNKKRSHFLADIVYAGFFFFCMEFSTTTIETFSVRVNIIVRGARLIPPA